MDYVSQLKNLPKKNDFFIGFDSDGCVFDTMELKHKECFCPAAIKHLGCQPVSKAAREVWDFVNLYSKTRGCNRFIAVQHFRNLLKERTDVKARGFDPMDLSGLDAWVQRETKLGNPALEAEVVENGNQDLHIMLDWSREVNARVEDMVSGMTPFPGVLDVLKHGRDRADMIVVSQTPLDALEREWEENNMTPYVRLIAGQEHGTKAEHIRFATEGKGYGKDRVLMVGDAPGDYKAAADNDALYYPIIPGQEEASWQRLVDEALERFFAGTFAGSYQQQLLDEFDASLPEHPPWENGTD
ncbi:HAD family hydrolase [Tichowtungia aerotolerans]|uniref:HAD hydrolase-like protein n=1 Tax=Tichowtungia aerotolerans TaxID=2697043 RepID=A0A6P1M8E5_9BACT|nr:HAD hydrolase-like protein [Tichowtungia aerotolerans]QHI69333.1 HAD hydrolase-like protein [Tichowtungia aerotolerans]